MKKKTVKKKLKPLSQSEHAELAAKVDHEGFHYYMTNYGPDMDAIARLGFDVKEVEMAVDLLDRLESKIYEGLDYDSLEDWD